MRRTFHYRNRVRPMLIQQGWRQNTTHKWLDFHQRAIWSLFRRYQPGAGTSLTKWTQSVSVKTKFWIGTQFSTQYSMVKLFRRLKCSHKSSIIRPHIIQGSCPTRSKTGKSTMMPSLRLKITQQTPNFKVNSPVARTRKATKGKSLTPPSPN